MIEELLKRKKVMLTEFLFNNKTNTIKGAGGTYTNDLIIPFVVSQNLRDLSFSSSIENNVKRKFQLWDNWYYLKIYCGVRSAEKILSEVVGNMVDKLEKDKIIEKWFFLRYADPDYHIRLRFYNSENTDFIQSLIQNIKNHFKEFVETNLIYKIQTETYYRELERYGPDSIEYCETIFYRDSQAVIKILELLDGDDGEEYRWLITLRNIDALLSDFNLELAKRYNIISTLYSSFLEEFGNSTELKRSINNSYRMRASLIKSFMDASKDEVNGLIDIAKIFYERTQHIAPIINEIIRSLSGDSVLYFSIITSLIHMSINRLMVFDPRKHELIIYGYLKKYYDYLINTTNERNV